MFLNVFVGSRSKLSRRRLQVWVKMQTAEQSTRNRGTNTKVSTANKVAEPALPLQKDKPSWRIKQGAKLTHINDELRP